MHSSQIVLLGIMSDKPVGGVVWQTLHYLVGLQRLGFDVYYVEAHRRNPSMFMRHEADDGPALAAEFIDRTLRPFGFGDKWALHALVDGRNFGLDRRELDRLYKSAELIINLHGATEPLPEHTATGRLLYLETDPVEVQIEISQGDQQAIEYLEPHFAFFSFGENYGRPGCGLPTSNRFSFRPTRQPVVLDFWDRPHQPGLVFTTIGNWRQTWRNVQLNGEVYSWSKHSEFEKFLDVVMLTGKEFELALSRYDAADRMLLESKGWRVRDALEFSMDPDAYRRYIMESRGEFTVAKDQNVRLRTGWFSDRSATYLASGRPVVTQETGFSEFIPTGGGLFAFNSIDEVLSAFHEIELDYENHSARAREIAREFFDYRVVLGRLLGDVGLSASGRSHRASVAHDLPPSKR